LKATPAGYHIIVLARKQATMKFTLHWLKDFLDTNAAPEQIADSLTAIGLELESMTNRIEALSAFRIGHILTTSPHPDADRLQICSVDVGEDTPKQIVCGAPNARTGIKVAYAPIGATIPANSMVLKPTKIRGIDSHGMLCSSRELELGDDHEGIMELPEEAQAGEKLSTLAGFDDVIFDIAITPDRGDCFGIMGIARDLAAKGVGIFISPAVPDISASSEASFPVYVENPDACPLLITRCFEDLNNRSTPDWMHQRLVSVGLKPISPLVDITNYLTIAYGRPAHMFDLDKLQGNLTVRDAKPGETLEALNHQTYIFTGGELILADEAGPVALAGVMGGTRTGCTESTQRALLEIAVFNPQRIAQSGQQHTITSDARMRFERGIDHAFASHGDMLATKLTLDLCGGKASSPQVIGEIKASRQTIRFNPARLTTLGSITLPHARMQEILISLGFTVDTAQKDCWNVTVPSWRHDVEGEADLVEELLRIHGYDQVEAALLPSFQRDDLTTPLVWKRSKAAIHRLAEAGFTECRNWSFISQELAQDFSDASPIELANPISPELACMRPSLLPGLLAALKRNMARSYPDQALAETGTVFSGINPENHHQHAAMLRSGSMHPPHPLEASRPVDVYDIKADILELLKAFQIQANSLQLKTNAPGWYHPGRFAALYQGKTHIAQFGEIHPALLAKLDIDVPVVVSELFLDKLPEPKKKKSTKPALQLSDFPRVMRDFAFIVSNDVAAESLTRSVMKADPKLITHVTLFDVYSGKGVEEGKKSLAINVELTPRSSTLTDEDIQQVSKNIIAIVEKNHGAVLRA
jgi:phenylalanyl-tRNA synthetase beta chain